MHQLLKVDGGVVCRQLGDGVLTPLSAPVAAGIDGPEQVSALDALRSWTTRYGHASIHNDDPAFREIGAEMFAWLDSAGALKDWMKQPERMLQVLPDDGSASELAAALIEAPWEVLHHQGYLAQDPAQLFVVSRRVMPAADPWQPQYGDVRMMFMAAAPEGQSELDYEAEEVSIINATKSTTGPAPLAHLVVEESGALEFLSERLDGRDGEFEVLHLSCHGDIIAPKGTDGTRDGLERPILLLETAEGEAHEVSAPDLIGACQGTLPPLMFVSACRTAQRGGSDTLRGAAGMRRDGFSEAPANHFSVPASRDMSGGPAEPVAYAAEPYVLELVRGVANVLGWDGSVYDHDASAFATSFYGALSRGKDVPTAAAMARRDLLREQAQDPRNGRHWHLARVYLGAQGGGPICRPGAEARDSIVAEPAFLDSENQIKVAGRDTFVGRRRTIQAAIAALRAGGHGLLAHGIGNLGKSSLAARIAGRLTGLRTVVVVSPKAELGSANARVIFAKLKAAVDALADAMPYGSEEAKTLREQAAAMQSDVAKDPSRFETILCALLAGPFKHAPIFLVLDDFENSLETPTAAAPIPMPEAHLLQDIQAVVHAFAQPGVTSRLMITCRYDFSVPDVQGNDLTVPFVKRIPLKPMSNRERVKQWQARERARKTDAGETADVKEIDPNLVARILAASSGNPGLQDVLTQPLLRGAEGEVIAALETIEAFLERGAVPAAEEDMGDFFTRMTFEVYESALDGTTRLGLSVASAFSPGVPIPRAGLTAGMEAVGVADPETALNKLLALGLLDDHGLQAGWRGMAKQPHAAINPLARPLADAMSDMDQERIAQVALPALAKAWQDDEGDFPFDLRAIEATLQAMRAPVEFGDVLVAAAESAVLFLFEMSQDAPAAVALAEPVFAKLSQFDHAPTAVLLGHSINAAERVGAVDLQHRLIDAALDRTDIEDRLMAQLKVLHSSRLMRLGELDGALRILETEVLPAFEALGDKRFIAVTKGQIADIKETRGDLDGALRIRETEQLLVYEALGDKSSIAVTKGKIADILQTRGDFDRALRILETELLPAFEALGDKRSIAVTKGKIADILRTRGDFDGALRICETEQLPVFEALGDKREIAVTKGKIAGILQTRGDLDGALRIRQTEQLPAFEALGDKRSIAVTKGQIANILQRRGDLDGALEMHMERLPTAESMQDLDGIVHIKFSCAQIRLQRGDHKKGDSKTVFEELDAAFRGAMQLQRPDAISAIGLLLAQILAAGDAKGPAHDVLDITERAANTLGNKQGLADIARLRDMIGDRDAPET